MKITISLFVGIILGLAISACATSFPYTSYGIVLKDTIADSMLLAASGSNKPDLSFSVCEANSITQSPCIAFLEADYLALKADYLNTKNELQSCQQQLRN